MKMSFRKIMAPACALLLAGLTACSSKTDKPMETTQAAGKTEAAVTEAQTTETITPLQMVLKRNQVQSSAEGDETYYIRYRLTCDLVELSEEAEDRYPQLENALEKYNEAAEDASEEMIKTLEESADSFFEAMPEAKDGDGGYLTDSRTPYVLRADSRVLSVLYYYDSFLGGAHPNRAYEGMNVDTATGKCLKLGDVVTDVDAFAAAVDEKLKEKYPEEYPYYFTDPVQAVKDSAGQDGIMAFTMGYEGMNVYFSPYNLGAYAMGEQILTIYYDEAPELFVPEYTQASEDYIVPFFDMVPTEADADGDGKREEIRVEEIVTDEYDGRDFAVHRGDAKCRLNTYGYYQKSYFVKSGGRYYVYVIVTSDNDYTLLYTVDLQTLSQPEREGMSADLVALDYDWEDYGTTTVFESETELLTDPANFRLSSHIDFLSTMNGVRRYHTGENGCPAPEGDELYYVSNNRALRVLQPITVDTVAKDGTVTGSATLKPDTYLFFIRTDNETFMDMQEVPASEVTGEETEWYSNYQTEDPEDPDWSKPVYRIREDRSVWPGTIDGIEEDKAFAGTMYAG